MHATCPFEIQFRWRYAITDVFNIDTRTNTPTLEPALKHQNTFTLMMEAARSSEISLIIYQTTKPQSLQSRSWQPQISQRRTHKISNRSKPSCYSVFKTRGHNVHHCFKRRRKNTRSRWWVFFWWRSSLIR
jgi:D-alanyl-D-alanine dipeptidase